MKNLRIGVQAGGSLVAVSALLAVAMTAACGGGGDGSSGGDGDGDGDVASSGGSTGDGDGDGDGDLGTGGQTSIEDPCGEFALDLTDFEGTSSAATDIAPGQWTNVTQMFGLGADLYILGNDALQVIRGGETTPESIGSDIPALANGGYTSGRRRLVVDETHAYFTTAAGIARIELSSGTTEVVWEGLVDGYTSDIWLTESTLFFGLYGEGVGIYEVPLDGSVEPTLITNFLDPLGFSYQDGTLYSATANDTVASQPATGGDLTVITDYSTHIFMDAMFVTAVGDRIVYSDGGDLMTCAIADCELPSKLSPQATDDLVVMGERVYWQTDSLGWAALDGSSCKNLVFGDFPDYVGVWGVTDDYVYLAGTFADVFGDLQVIRIAP